MILSTRVNHLAFLCALVALACSDKPDASTAKTGAPGGGGGGGSGRSARSITLNVTDVDSVRRGSLSDGIPVTGNLRPIETVDIRARLDGEIAQVYVREGNVVRAGQVIARFESSEEESSAQSAIADRASARSELSTAQWNMEQTEELFKAGAVPERDMRAAQQSVTAARARVAAAEARLRAASNVRSDTRVTSPTSGIVSARHIEPGEHVAKGNPLLTVVRNSVLELVATVPERRASSISQGQRVEFNAAGRQFTGRVSRVSPVVDPANRSITVYVQIPNSNGALKGGTFASGTVIARAINNTLVVPSAAIRYPEGSKEPFVYKIDGRVVDQVKVSTGVSDDRLRLTEITSGLSQGDRVIVGNVGVIGKGMQVEILGGDKSSNEAN